MGICFLKKGLLAKSTRTLVDENTVTPKKVLVGSHYVAFPVVDPKRCPSHPSPEHWADPDVWCAMEFTPSESCCGLSRLAAWSTPVLPVSICKLTRRSCGGESGGQQLAGHSAARLRMWAKQPPSLLALECCLLEQLGKRCQSLPSACRLTWAVVGAA